MADTAVDDEGAGDRCIDTAEPGRGTPHALLFPFANGLMVSSFLNPPQQAPQDFPASVC